MMDGQPVWCESIGDTTRPSGWCIYHFLSDCCHNHKWIFPVNDSQDDAYGETWLAYDRSPEEE